MNGECLKIETKIELVPCEEKHETFKLLWMFLNEVFSLLLVSDFQHSTFAKNYKAVTFCTTIQVRFVHKLKRKLALNPESLARPEL